MIYGERAWLCVLASSGFVFAPSTALKAFVGYGWGIVR